MAKYNYVLSYNPMNTAPTAESIQIFISQNRDIESWYQAFLGTYIVKSDRELAYLTDQFVQFFSPSQFILTWMYPNHASGFLPNDAWKWFNGVAQTELSVK